MQRYRELRSVSGNLKMLLVGLVVVATAQSVSTWANQPRYQAMHNS